MALDHSAAMDEGVAMREANGHELAPEVRAEIEALMSSPVKGLPSIFVVGDDCVSGVYPLSAPF